MLADGGTGEAVVTVGYDPSKEVEAGPFAPAVRLTVATQDADALHDPADEPEQEKRPGGPGDQPLHTPSVTTPTSDAAIAAQYSSEVRNRQRRRAWHGLPIPES